MVLCARSPGVACPAPSRRHPPLHRGNAVPRMRVLPHMTVLVPAEPIKANRPCGGRTATTARLHPHLPHRRCPRYTPTTSSSPGKAPPPRGQRRMIMANGTVLAPALAGRRTAGRARDRGARAVRRLGQADRRGRCDRSSPRWGDRHGRGGVSPAGAWQRRCRGPSRPPGPGDDAGLPTPSRPRLCWLGCWQLGIDAAGIAARRDRTPRARCEQHRERGGRC